MGLALSLAVVALSGCALLAPLPKPPGVAERLAAFPTRGLPLTAPETIHWSDRQVPFVEAETDEDAASALCLVLARLRLGQMATARMIAEGRLPETVAPLGIDIDRGLRTLPFARAAAEIEQTVDGAARLRVQRIADGVDYCQVTTAELPHDFGILGLEREFRTVQDTVAIGRLAGTDVNWLVWTKLLPLRGRADRHELQSRLPKDGTTSATSFGGTAHTAAIRRCPEFRGVYLRPRAPQHDFIAQFGEFPLSVDQAAGCRACRVTIESAGSLSLPDRALSSPP